METSPESARTTDRMLYPNETQSNTEDRREVGIHCVPEYNPTHPQKTNPDIVEWSQKTISLVPLEEISKHLHKTSV